MSHFLDRLTYFRRTREKFSDGHGITTDEARDWEDAYRNRGTSCSLPRADSRAAHGLEGRAGCAGSRSAASPR